MPELPKLTANVWAGIIMLVLLILLIAVRRGFRGLVVEIGE